MASTLARKLSFSRTKRASQPPVKAKADDIVTGSEASSSEPPSPDSVKESPQFQTTARRNMVDEVVLCSKLQGWLRKKHSSSRVVAPKWSSRYFAMDDEAGVLLYSKGLDGKSRARIAMADIHSVRMLDDSPNAFRIVVDPSYCFSQLTLSGDDREESLMWVNQLNKRMQLWKEHGQGGVIPRRQPDPPALVRGAETKEISAQVVAAPAPSPGTVCKHAHDLRAAGATAARARARFEEDRMERQAAERARYISASGSSEGGGVPLQDPDSASGAGVFPRGRELRTTSGPHRNAPLKLARVVANFTSEHPLELSVNCGDVVLPTGEVAPEGWIHVLTGSSNGIVPTSFVQMVQATSAIAGATHFATTPQASYAASPCKTSPVAAPWVDPAAPPGGVTPTASPHSADGRNRRTLSLEEQMEAALAAAAQGDATMLEWVEEQLELEPELARLQEEKRQAPSVREDGGVEGARETDVAQAESDALCTHEESDAVLAHGEGDADGASDCEDGASEATDASQAALDPAVQPHLPPETMEESALDPSLPNNSDKEALTGTRREIDWEDWDSDSEDIGARSAAQTVSVGEGIVPDAGFQYEDWDSEGEDQAAK
mmetsp:Transcript_15334/g.36779  ORF Transcript_15334/g.36779 Transcript_15334/m.36779 type:complete len:605 (-) Transcript_15334:266-2080(-)